MDTWTFIWLLVGLKIPIAMLLGIVWWAVHQTDDELPVREDDGGIKHLGPHDRHPHRPPRPRRPRRGPHGGQVACTPPRVRTVAARARSPRPLR